MNLDRVRKIKSNKYFSYKIWRCWHTYNNITKMPNEIKISSRSSNVPNFFIKNRILIYDGKRWTSKKINKWSVGYKIGSLTWNKKKAVFKTKPKNK